MNKYIKEKDISGCSIFGLINTDGEKVNGSVITDAISVMHDRANGLGGGFAGYGIYPDYPDDYAFHLFFDSIKAKEETEELLNKHFLIEYDEKIRTDNTIMLPKKPLLWRYFVKNRNILSRDSEREETFQVVMDINNNIDGAYVISSGKNMGVFKGVGYPEDISKFYRLEEYNGYIWTAHGRFPTNTPGWWGGAHPFGLLDWTIVHNGEISSYDTNRRYLEMYGYKCNLVTDTEVITYLFDFLVRKNNLTLPLASKVLASPMWTEIDRMNQKESELLRALRMTYSSALLTGPFSVILGFENGIMGLSDRLKLRPMIVAKNDNTIYMSSEECAVRKVCPDLDSVYRPKGGEPVISLLDGNYV
ncbi:MAG: glucosamine--fructose-6-phosphate aminotransferase [Candidatus Methanofastidiosum methylothiophilum]|uniref:Glucosamine--fructose-6-phosphate aminotransferase n=1 Tax=Candidatus Methanofastidiosum methylothiophilum TaxID=1705564 RepID=A0A150IP32_9EURY|nr:MAG: glucosamine--fructose-6-phosphate aminotransferase [Candidatus Methanofastidiosum methylthiophilus]NMC76623.1 glutamine amidotransferase family protein [Candidatus Methanofastidiosa archaeon]